MPMMTDDEYQREIMTVTLMEKDETGGYRLTDAGALLMEKMEEVVETRVNEAVGDALAQVKKILDRLARNVGSAAERAALIRQIAVLNKAGALDSHDGDWSTGADDDSVANRNSIAGSAKNEEAETIRAVFNDVAEPLTEDQAEQLKDLVEDWDFYGDAGNLHAKLTEARDTLFPHATPGAHYAAAISKALRRY